MKPKLALIGDPKMKTKKKIKRGYIEMVDNCRKCEDGLRRRKFSKKIVTCRNCNGTGKTYRYVPTNKYHIVSERSE